MPPVGQKLRVPVSDVRSRLYGHALGCSAGLRDLEKRRENAGRKQNDAPADPHIVAKDWRSAGLRITVSATAREICVTFPFASVADVRFPLGAYPQVEWIALAVVNGEL
jgi:hypothetical protein